MLVSLWSSSPTAARAADEPVRPDVEAVSVAAVTPPILLTVADTEPPGAAELDQPTAVDLLLTIQPDGSVSSVRVIAPGTPLLDDAARARALGFRFEPARLQSEPISVEVEYRYWFIPEPSAPETAGDEPDDGGETTDASLAGAGSAPAPASPPGSESEAIAPAESSPEAADAAAAEAGVTELSDVFEAVAEVVAPPREPTRRELPVERLVRVPGTRGDALRAVETLPGVARAPQGTNPIIRGSAQFESATFVDGTHLPLLYHFGGVTSVIPSRLLSKVELHPGNFSARYGRVSGGIIEARLRDPRSDRLAAVVDASLVDTGAIVETPLSDDVAVAFGARRSNIDFVFESFVPDGTFDVVAAPVYWDYQNIWSFDLHRYGKLRLAAFGTRDQLELVFDQPSRVDPQFDGEISGALEHHRVQLRHEVQIAAARQTVTLTVGKDVLTQRFGSDMRANLDAWAFDGRGQWDVPIGSHVDFSAGFDVATQFYFGGYRGSSASSDEGSGPIPDAGREALTVDETSFALISPAVWTEVAVALTDEWMVIPGFRADYFRGLSAVTLNPRFTQRYALTESTTLKNGLGWFSQAPVYYESLDPVGNPDIKPSHALHTSLGVEHRFSDRLQVGAEGFHKYLYDRIVGTDGGVPPKFINDGRGRVYGLETNLDFVPTSTTYAVLSYTLSRSERQDRDDPWRLFDLDQTHVLSLAASQDLGAGWELGARFRYVTGNPKTPIDRAVFDAGSGQYVPVLGAINSARDSAFHQLDVRAQKTFTWDAFSLAVYLDVQNAYNRENAEGEEYSYDYSQREQVSGLPFFPNFGVRGEL